MAVKKKPDDKPWPAYIEQALASLLGAVVNVKDFGAVGDGEHDDTAAIQAAIDFAVYNNSPTAAVVAGKIFLPGGRYKISDTLHLGYGETFRSAHLAGSGRRMRGQPRFSGTALVPTFNDRPAIAVSGGRQTTIRSLSIVGRNFRWIGQNRLGEPDALIDDLVDANWVDPSFPASASSQFAPYAGIAIDAYLGERPAVHYPDVKFPAWLGVSRQYNKSASSQTVIEDVEIAGFVVGVVNNPSDGDGNGDFTKLLHCEIERCQYAVSIGQTQSRLVRVSSSSISNCYTGLTTSAHGLQNGKPQALFDSTQLSSVIHWLTVPNTSYGAGLKFLNCYGETFYTIGSIGTVPASRTCPVAFDGCEFSFASWSGKPFPKYWLDASGGGPVSFRDCAFSRGTQPNLYIFGGDPGAYRFDNCSFITGGATTKLYEKHAINATAGIVVGNTGASVFGKFSVRNSALFDLTAGINLGARLVSDEVVESSRQIGACVYAKRISSGFDQGDSGIPFLLGRNAINKASAGISVTGRTLTLDLTTVKTAAQLIQNGGEVGDVLTDQATGTVFIVSARNPGPILTAVAQNNYDAAGNLLEPVTNNGVMWAMNCRIYTPGRPIFGDSTAGNATVASLKLANGGNYALLDNAAGGLQAGDFIYIGQGHADHPTDPAGGKVDALTPDSMTLSSPLGKTEAGKRYALFIRQAPANGS